MPSQDRNLQYLVAIKWCQYRVSGHQLGALWGCSSTNLSLYNSENLYFQFLGFEKNRLGNLFLLWNIMFAFSSQFGQSKMDICLLEQIINSQRSLGKTHTFTKKYCVFSSNCVSVLCHINCCKTVYFDKHGRWKSFQNVRPRLEAVLWNYALQQSVTSTSIM